MTSPPGSDRPVDAVSDLGRLQTRVFILSLLGATWLVPLAVLRPGDAEVASTRPLWRVLPSLTDIVGTPADPARPYAQDWGTGLLVVGAIVLVVGLAAAAWSALADLHLPGRASLLVHVGVMGLLVGSLLLTLGLVWLPAYEDPTLGATDVGPAAGLWVPVLAAVTIATLRRPLRALGTDGPAAR